MNGLVGNQRGKFMQTVNGRVAYIVKSDVAEPISTGARNLFSVEVLNGRSLGDTVIVSGTDQFNGAQRVLIIR